MALIVAAALAYALGTFPTAKLVGNASGHDVLHEGSGNPGASNVYRLAGRRAGITVFAGDLLKGVIGTFIGLIAGRHGAYVAGPAVVVGHCFPITRRLRGGKGVATGAGFALVVEPVIALAAAVVWFTVVHTTRRASLASIVIAVGFPVATAIFRGWTGETAAVTAVAVLIVVRHAGNVARLVRGQERTV